jgi:hypothetical protein
MINFSVPKDHPLTPSKHAADCVTVVDMQNQECGVYVDVIRAMVYIRDWLKEVTDMMTVDLDKVNDDYWQVRIDGKVAYRIKRTCFRY